MKKGFLGCAMVFLSGCAGCGDRLPDVQVGQVTLTRHTPCITYRVAAGDRLSSIQIADNAAGGEIFIKSYKRLPFTRRLANACRRWVIISKAAENMWCITAWIIRTRNESVLLK